MTPMDPFDTAERQFFSLYWYQKPGDYTSIDAMRCRAKTLLHTKRVTISPGFVYEIRHADDFGDSWDDALGCPMSYSRYSVIQLRS